MTEHLKKCARTAATFFPFLKDFSYIIKRTVRTVVDSPVEDDFNVIDRFPPREGMLFLDVGANQGVAIDVFLRKNRSCRIHSFEPNPHVFTRLHARFKANSRVKLHNFGLGEEDGRFMLFVPVYRGYEFDGLGTLSPEFSDTWFSQGLYFYNPKHLQMRERNCEIRRLDDLDLAPFFMKVDVEGFELAVMRGGKETIGTCHPIILVETGERPHVILDFLRQFGYRLYSYRGGKFIEGVPGSPNSFFITDEKYSLIDRAS